MKRTLIGRTSKLMIVAASEPNGAVSMAIEIKSIRRPFEPLGLPLPIQWTSSLCGVPRLCSSTSEIDVWRPMPPERGR